MHQVIIGNEVLIERFFDFVNTWYLCIHVFLAIVIVLDTIMVC